ncbi:MAG TPA: Hsp20/alpha crystallin family protein [Bacteroidia bacterium]|nr:Hsp20/alpha crystallin family protein [Bacteroidia bacterium]
MLKDKKAVDNPFDSLGEIFSAFGEASKNIRREEIKVPVNFRVVDDITFIDFEVPGYKAHEIDIEFKGGILSVIGKKEEFNDVYATQQFKAIDFKMNIKIKRDIDPSKLIAKLEDGILSIELPIGKEKHSYKIQVN